MPVPEVLYEIDGETKSLSEWARTVGIDRRLIHRRINTLGWTPEKAVTTPPRGYDRVLPDEIEFRGKRMSVTAWAAHFRIPPWRLRLRLLRGLDFETAVSLKPYENPETAPAG